MFAARRVGGESVTVLDYRGALGAKDGSVASTVEQLGDEPLAARDLVIAHIDGRAPRVAPAAGPGQAARDRLSVAG